MIDGNFNKMQWFMGVIESVDDPERINRVKVRCIGYHSEDRGKVDVDSLPWAAILTNTANMSSPNYVQGDWVVGFFLDGEKAEQPVVWGMLHGIPNTKPDSNRGFSDPDGVYPNRIGEPTTPRVVNGENLEETNVTWQKQTIMAGIKKADGSLWAEPPTEYNADYKSNHVIQTPRYNMIELDDTIGFERVHIFHRKGTFIEMHPDGDIVIRSMGSHNVIVNGPSNLYASGDVNLSTPSNVNILSNGDTNISTGGKVNWKVGGDMLLEVGGNLDLAIGGDTNIGAAGTNRFYSGGNTFVEGAKVYLADGISNPVGAPTSPYRTDAQQTDAFGAIVGDDDDASPEGNQARAANLQALGITPRAGAEPIVGESATPSANPVESVPSTPTSVNRNGAWKTIRCGKYKTVSDFTMGGTRDPWKNVLGLPGEEIIQNMVDLGKNVIDPLIDAGLKFNINSGYRVDSRSNHGTGGAIDIQFTTMSAFQAAKKIFSIIGGNPGLYQCFTEYNGNGSGSGWIHIAYYDSKRKSRFAKGSSLKPATAVLNSDYTTTFRSTTAYVDLRPADTTRFNGTT